MNPNAGQAKLREHVKSVILVLLFALMIFFSALYFVGTQSAMISPEMTMPLDRLLTMKNGDTGSSLNSPDLSDCLPEMVAYRIDTAGGALVANRDLMRDFSQLFEEYFDFFFGSEAVCSLTNHSSGEASWKQMIESNRYLYIRYPGELPYPLIYSFYHSQAVATFHAEGDIVYVCELLIDLDGKCALSRDKAGNYAIFSCANHEDSSFNLSALCAYNENKSFCSFRMSNKEDDGYALGVPLIEDSITANLLLCETKDPTLLFSLPDMRNTLLKIFDFNPDNLRSYDDNGSTVFIEDHGTLILSPEGSLTYESSTKKGIRLDDILGYSSYNGEYTLTEAMKAACTLGSLFSKMSSNAADLRLLTVISAEDEDSAGVCFIFSYFYNNIPIFNDTDALRITVTDNKITSVCWMMYSYTDTLIAEIVLPLHWLESNLFHLAAIPNAQGRCRLAYSVVKRDGENVQIGCGWNYIYSKS